MKLKKFLATIFTLVLIFGTLTPCLAAKNISALGKVSTQKKYTMYLGTNDKDTQKREIPLKEIQEQMHEICMKYVDGYTLTVADGYFKDSEGKPYREIALVYVFIDAPIESIKKIMDEALVKFNQSSILLEESEGKSIFYSGAK